MVLCHGRAPLLFNKLQHGGDWNARLRDVAGVTRFSSRTLERLLNWQIVKLDNKMEDLLEAPVLYMRGETEWTFDDVQVQKIREFCQRGGMVFAVAGGPDFQKGFDELARRAFPDLPIRPVPKEHPLLTGEVQFAIKETPDMVQVHNGVRTLMLYCGRDLGSSWNKGVAKGPAEADFQLATNVYLFATDKAPVKSRLETTTIPLKKVEVQRTIKVARIKYQGNWDLESYGWTRLGAYMNNETGTRILVTGGVTLDAANLKDFPVAYLTGAEAFELAPEEVKGLRQYLSGGGTLLADAAGGSREFTKALEKYVKEATLGEAKSVPQDSYLLTGQDPAGPDKTLPGFIDLSKIGYQRAARAAAKGLKYPRLMGFRSKRRYEVIYSELDLCTALLGTHVYNVQGYEPEGALQIMRNLLLYASLPAGEKARLERGK
jgi:hypothetical protein